MKKSLLFSAGLLLSCTLMQSQPVLTSSGINPVIGNIFTNVSSAYTSPGPGGASQTWNLTLNTTGNSTTSVVAVSSTSYSASFSTCNLATTGNGTSFEYFNANSNAYQSYGSANSSLTNSYSNPEDRLRFPLTYNDNYTDGFSSVFTNSGNTTYRTGQTNVTADGYGTLTTPAGTFNNVLRVHSVFSYQDSSAAGILHFQRDQYAWYLNGNHTSLASVNSITITPVSGSPVTNQGAGYLTNVTAGINSFHSAAGNISVFPNPACGDVFVNFNRKDIPASRVIMFNSLGAQAEISFKEIPEGYSVNTSGLAPGVYFLAIYSDETLTATRKLVISR